MRGLDIALACAERGWRVFPVSIVYKSGGKTEKHPLIAWKTESTEAPDEIRRLWSLHTAARCGVVTGRGSRLYVVDADTPEAREWIRAALEAEGIAAGYWQARTNRPGGWHYYFGPPDDGLDVPNSQDGGLDVRGDGGMVVCWHGPPEPHVSLIPLPHALAEWARTRTREPATTERDRAIPEVIQWPGGGSDAWVVSMVGSMCRRGFREEAALAAMLAENEHGRFDPPCDNEWLQMKVRGVYERYYNPGQSVSSAVMAALEKLHGNAR